MSTGIFAALDTLTTNVTALQASVTALQAAPASGVTQTELDATNAAVATVSSDLEALKTLVGSPT